MSDKNNNILTGASAAPKRLFPLGRRGGFTIIELLVALAIGSLVMAGMVQMFRGNRDAFTLLDDLKNMEQNGRIAVDFLSRDFRAASSTSGADAPIIEFDNQDGAYTSVQSALGAVAGTDIVEIFTSTCAQPVSFPSYNENSAAMAQVIKNALVGCMECYNLNLSQAELGECAAGYNVKIVDVDSGSSPTGYSCRGDMTDSSSWQGGNWVNLNFNRGNDNANRPRQCSNPNHAGPNWDAVFTIGEDLYYYVRQSAAGENNPQLVRYRVGGDTEVVANYVEDLQVAYGEDTNSDGVVDAWVDGDAVSDMLDVLMVRINIMVKATRIDPKKSAEAPPVIENSTISSTPDKYRRRILTRTVRLRNMGN